MLSSEHNKTVPHRSRRNLCFASPIRWIPIQCSRKQRCMELQWAMQRKFKRLYHERLSARRVFDARIFQRLHQQLCERGSFSSCMQDTGCGTSVRRSFITNNIMQLISERLEPGTRTLSQSVHVSHQTMWQVLREGRPRMSGTPEFSL